MPPTCNQCGSHLKCKSKPAHLIEGKTVVIIINQIQDDYVCLELVKWYKSHSKCKVLTFDNIHSYYHIRNKLLRCGRKVKNIVVFFLYDEKKRMKHHPKTLLYDLGSKIKKRNLLWFYTAVCVYDKTLKDRPRTKFPSDLRSGERLGYIFMSIKTRDLLPRILLAIKNSKTMNDILQNCDKFYRPDRGGSLLDTQMIS